MFDIASLSLEDWRNLLAIFGSLFALVAGVYKFAASKQPQVQLAIHEQETRLFDNLRETVPHFEANYNDEVINDLSVSQFFIWNSGTEALRASNIASLDPVRIELPPEARILECTVLRATSPSIDFHAIPTDEHTVEVQFEYLNKRDGALVQVVFTGATGENTEVKGQLVGPRPSIEYTGDEHYRVHGYRGSGGVILLTSWLQVASGVLNLLVGGLLMLAYALGWSSVGFWIGLALVVLSIWLWVPSRNKVPRPLREGSKVEQSVDP